MVTFDGEYTVIVHFEADEQAALEKGGINIESLKKNAVQFPDWLLSAISESIELEDNDSCTVIPVEQKLMIDNKEIVLDTTTEDYDVKLNDGTYQEAKEENKE